jgi:hypothetical protein
MITTTSQDTLYWVKLFGQTIQCISLNSSSQMPFGRTFDIRVGLLSYYWFYKRLSEPGQIDLAIYVSPGRLSDTILPPARIQLLLITF